MQHEEPTVIIAEKEKVAEQTLGKRWAKAIRDGRKFTRNGDKIVSESRMKILQKVPFDPKNFPLTHTNAKRADSTQNVSSLRHLKKGE